MSTAINESEKENGDLSGRGPRILDNAHPGLVEKLNSINPEESSRASNNQPPKIELEAIDAQDIKIKYVKESEKGESTSNRKKSIMAASHKNRVLFAKQKYISGPGKNKNISLRTENEPSLKEILFRQKIMRFIQNLRGNAGLKDIRKPTANVLNIINDLSYDRIPEPEELENSFVSKRIRTGKHSIRGLLLQYFNHQISFLREFFTKKANSLWKFFEKKVPTIKPLSKLKLVWDFIMLMLIFWHLISLTLLLSFEIRPWQAYSILIVNFRDDTFFEVFQYVSFILLITDILLKFNTGSFESGVVIYEKGKLVRDYFKNGFFYDFIGLIPFMLYLFKFIPEKAYPYYFLVFIFKIRPLSIFFNNLTEGLFSFEGKKESVFLLLKLLTKVFLVCHLFACAWHLTALSNFGERNWVKNMGLEENCWEERYLKAIYYVVVTMTTTGYGDITPQNRDETLLSIFCMFTGSVIVGYSINSIRDILKRAASNSKFTKKKLQILNSFMTRNCLAFELQVKIRKYLRYIWSRNLEQDKEAHDILKELPYSLREEILINTQKRFLKGQTIFDKYFSPETVSRLAPMMKPIHLSPEEWIYFVNDENEGDLDDESLYVVSSGNVELLADCVKRGFKRTLLRIQNPQTVFGELSFFTGFPRECSAKAQDVCTLLKIDKSDFLNIIKQNHKDYETFCLIRDQLVLDLTRFDLNLKCIACNDNQHSLSDCPWISHKPSKDTVIKRYLFHQPQLRKSFLRRRTLKSENSLLNLFTMQNVADRIRDDPNHTYADTNKVMGESVNTFVSENDSPRNGFIPEPENKEFLNLNLKQNQPRRSVFLNTGIILEEVSEGHESNEVTLFTKTDSTVTSNKTKMENNMTEKRRESVFSKLPRQNSLFPPANNQRPSANQRRPSKQLALELEGVTKNNPVENEEERHSWMEPTKVVEIPLIPLKILDKIHCWKIYMPHNNIYSVLFKTTLKNKSPFRYNQTVNDRMESVISQTKRNRKTLKKFDKDSGSPMNLRD